MDTDSEVFEEEDENEDEDEEGGVQGFPRQRGLTRLAC
jgi:hypothetical protein